MARQPMVTRTIQTTTASILCLNLVTAEPFNKEVVLPRTYKDEKAIMKAAEKIINTDEVKAVHVSASRANETLYGMTEQDFINSAVILPARETKTN